MRPVHPLCLFVVFLAFLPLAAVASSIADVPESPTFYEDVLPILQENCQTCHRPGGSNLMGMIAPMAFMDYGDARPWSKAIARQVKERTMPPWHATKEFEGTFANERTLTDAEIETLVRWARTGATKGSSDQAPAAVSFERDDWSIGEPDLVLTFDEPVLVADHEGDVYKTVTLTIPKEQLPEDRFIRSMEFRPGSAVVHHIVIFTDDARESLGFAQGMLGGMGPGTDPTYFPEGYGRRLRSGSTIMFNMHYHKEPGPGTAVYDSSSIAFRFQDQPVEHEVHWGAIGTMVFSIPPFAENHEVVARESFDHDVLLFALFPHTHLRGKASRYTAFYPDGTQEVLLDVPNYDFNWQTNYIYNEPKRIPAGTAIQVQMWYENTKERGELAGIDPSRTVPWGTPTTDEMMYGWIDYARVGGEE